MKEKTKSSSAHSTRSFRAMATEVKERKSNLRIVVRVCLPLMAIIALGSLQATAQTYPSKPLTLVVPFPPGAATDVFARAAGRRMGELMNAQVIILNRDGASGAIGTEMVAKA